MDRLIKNNSDKIERSAIANMIIKPISILLGLLYTPLLLKYLGDERYGLWSTVLSIISWINYFDVGIGNGLRNVLSKELEEKQLERTKKAVSTAYIVLSALTLLIYVLLLLSVFYLNWNGIFTTTIDMQPTLLISFTFICLNFVLSLVNTILYALQMAEKIAVRNSAVQLLNIIGILVLMQFSSRSLIGVAILFGVTQLFVNVGNTMQVMKTRSYLRPSFRSFDKTFVRSICNVGIKFFIIQIMCLAMFTVDNLLITHFWGALEVTPFSIANKYFNTIYSIFAAYMVPYWSGTTSALARNDNNWIINSIKKTIKVLLLFIIAILFLAILFKPITKLWLGKELNYQPKLILVMAVFYCFYSVLCFECQYINGTGLINTQMVMYIILGIANIPFSVYLGKIVGLEAVGVRLATLILVVIADIVLGINLKVILRRYRSANSD